MNSIDNIEERVKYILLPPAFITKGFIGGKDAPSCNYEKYLAELLDESAYFRRRTSGKPIKLIEQQDRGQPDICENGFSLDFKLIAGESAITAKKLTAESITHIANGGIAYGVAKGKRQRYKAVRIHLALRKYSCDDLLTLSQNYRNDDTEQRDVVRILSNLRTDKNLLLYLPYAVIVDEADDCIAKEMVRMVLEDCFGSSLEYRKRMVPDKETFFCCIHNQQMLIYVCQDNKLVHIDAVNTYQSKTFRSLARYYDLFNASTIDAIIGCENLNYTEVDIGR